MVDVKIENMNFEKSELILLLAVVNEDVESERKRFHKAGSLYSDDVS